MLGLLALPIGVNPSGWQTAGIAATIHINPTADLAERVLLPGDPGRALRLATELIEGPKMFNHNRGLWGYSGTARDGEPLTIQSTGMGGPSAAIVVHELIELGARTLLRVGTCGALAPDLHLGQLLIATEALAADGASRALGAGERVAASTTLVDALGEAAQELDTARGLIATCDLFYDALDAQAQWRDAGVLAVEMEAAVVFRQAERRGLTAGTLLIVSDHVFGTPARIDAEALEAAELQMGEIALSALTILGRTSTSA